MRKIEHHADIEARNKRRSRYMTVFMLSILLASTLGYAFLSNPDDTSSNGSTTTGDLNGGITVQGSFIPLVNSKEKIANVSVQIKLGLGDYSGKKVYVVSDNDAVSYELASTVGRYAEAFQNACYNNCSKNLPEKDCTDYLIIWNSTLDNKVYQQDNCIFIDGDMRAVDAFIYRMFQ